MTAVTAFRLYSRKTKDYPGSKIDILSKSQLCLPGFLQVMSMGFAADSSREALKRFYGNVQQAINMLESCGGTLSSLQQLTRGKCLGLSLTGGWHFFLLFRDCRGPEKCTCNSRISR